MDNITHSVVGLGIGALIDRSVAPEPDAAAQRTRTRMLLTVCCLASNFPDLDLVLTRLIEAPLGYLLHHRGHTHTLVAGIAEIAVLLGLVWLLWPAARALLRTSPRARMAALGAACVGLVLHMTMDGLNVYGVHPFWPFDARWFYGDLVFIVEPVFWVAFGVPLAAMMRRRLPRALLLALLAVALAGFTALRYLQWGSLAGLLALGAALGWIAWRRRGDRGRHALAAGLAASLAFVAVQALALHAVRADVAQTVARLDPGERLLDMAMTAYPANPLCWSFVTVAEDAAHGGYHLRRGLLSLAPGVSPVTACPARIGGRATHPDAADGARLAWQHEARHSLAQLRDLQKNNCHFDAWMRFARAPAVDAAEATDLRWSPFGNRNFSTIDYAAVAARPCPQPVPDWGYPRADLLLRPDARAEVAR